MYGHVYITSLTRLYSQCNSLYHGHKMELWRCLYSKYEGTALHSTRFNVHKHFPAPCSINNTLRSQVQHVYEISKQLRNHHVPDVRGSADWPSHVIPYAAARFGRIDQTQLFASSRARYHLESLWLVYPCIKIT